MTVSLRRRPLYIWRVGARGTHTMPNTSVRVIATSRRTAAALLLTLFMVACSLAPTSTQPPYDPLTMDPPTFDAAHPPAIVEFNFPSHGSRLNSILYEADGVGPHPTVVLLHGYPGNERNLDMAQALRRAGFNVLFFHYRGAWGSEGEFSFTHVIEDVASAAEVLRQRADHFRVDPARLLFVGHSMGGFAALEGAARDEDIHCVAGIAPADFGALARYVEANPQAAAAIEAEADGLQMLHGWSSAAMRAELRSNQDAFGLVGLGPRLRGKSVLLIAAAQDEVIPPLVFHAPIADAYRAEPEISLTEQVIPGDHAFSWSRIALTRAVIDWAMACAEQR